MEWRLFSQAALAATKDLHIVARDGNSGRQLRPTFSGEDKT
jgi:hypothetical protein